MTAVSAQIDRGRLATVAAIAAVVIAAWSWLLTGAGLDMGRIGPGLPWTLAHTAHIFAMWTAMMAAMMLPSSLPAVDRIMRGGGEPAAAVFFSAGFLSVWVAVSFAATLVQRELEAHNLLSDALSLRSKSVAAIALVAIGLAQFGPVKQVCLGRCRALTARVSDYPRRNRAMFGVGLSYGVFCAGCCALMMGLLFVVGVMNVAWIAILTVWMLAEKALPVGADLARAAGLGLIAWGTLLLAPPLL